MQVELESIVVIVYALYWICVIISMEEKSGKLATFLFSAIT